MGKSLLDAMPVGSSTALITNSRNWSFDAILKSAESIEGFLRKRGCDETSIVAVMAHVGPSYVASLLGAWMTGCCAALVNPLYTVAERKQALETLSATFVLGDAASDPSELGLSTTPDMLEKLDGMWAANLARVPDRASALPDDAVIIFTSGSAGRPKGVVLNHESLLQNALAVSEYLLLSSSDRSVVFTPAGYIYAFSQTFTHLISGASVVGYTKGLRFPADLLSVMEQIGATGVAANPTSLRLFRRLHRKRSPLSNVRYVMTGGQPLDSALAAETLGLFERARLINTYGATENSPRISYYVAHPNPQDHVCPWPVGRPVAGTTIRIDSPDNEGKGQILVGGSSVFDRYLNDPKATDERKTPSGEVRTGDVGYVDTSGNLYLIGRSDDVILVGHEKVGPEEVEGVINSVPGVLESAVVGIHDELLHQVPIAFVVFESQDEDEVVGMIRVRCGEALSPSRQPRLVVSADGLPKNLYGKLNRAALRRTVDTEGVGTHTWTLRQ